MAVHLQWRPRPPRREDHGPTRRGRAKIVDVGPTSGPEVGGTVVPIETRRFEDDFMLDGPTGGGTVDVEVHARGGQSARLANASVYTP